MSAGSSRPAPELEFQSVLRQHWSNDSISLSEPPRITTGEYRRGDTPLPIITIIGGNEGPQVGSDTGYSAMDGSGLGALQRVGGAVTIDCVAGTYDDLVQAGESGIALNPKQVRWELYDHAAQLLVDYQHETGLKTVSPGEANSITESVGSGDNVTYEFRTQFRARYQYDRRPRPTQ